MGCSSAIAGLAGSRFNTLAFADTEGSFNEEILVVVFLRGGMDGLNVIVPVDGADRGFYEAARPTLQVPTNGAGAALGLSGPFGLHPSAAPLLDLYQDGRLSVIHGTGMAANNRSHFDAMEYIELGTPGNKSTTSGWLTRHLLSAANLPQEIVMPSVSVGYLQQASLLGDRSAINLTDPESFNLNTGPYHWRDAQRLSLRRLYSGDTTWLHDSGLQALNALDILELNVTGDYVPANGAVYPEGEFGDHLQIVARMIKLGLGMRVATLDLGGWDTHEGQGEGSGGFFATLLAQLANGLHAFYTDLDGAGSNNFTQRLTVVVESEFGRTVGQNGDGGTDHGHGNPMFVLSGNALGGLHGTFPGLHPDQQDEGDLAVTTDYRRVLSEILIRRMGNNQLGDIFPGYTDYQPLGIVSGTDLPPDYGAGAGALHIDGFESGNASLWDAAVGGS